MTAHPVLAMTEDTARAADPPSGDGRALLGEELAARIGTAHPDEPLPPAEGMPR